MMVGSTMTIQDILPYGSNKSNGKKLDTDAILPFIILPLLLVICTISRLVTIIVMILIGMGALYAQSRPRNKNRSPFFFHWTMSSGVCMFVVFEICVLSLLEITQLENFIFLLLLSSTCYFFYKMKAVADFELATGGSKGKEYSPVLTSDSYYCQICQIEVNERFFHSIWWDCCILRANYIYFLSGQIFSFATLLYGTNLGLTTVCQPYILYGNILMPEDCNDVYYEFEKVLYKPWPQLGIVGLAYVCLGFAAAHIYTFVHKCLCCRKLYLALGFVSCIYGIGYLLVTAFVLVRQIFIYIPKYSEPQWKKLINVLTV